MMIYNLQHDGRLNAKTSTRKSAKPHTRTSATRCVTAGALVMIMPQSLHVTGALVECYNDENVDKKRKVLIFCNKGSTSAFLNHYLNEKGIKTLHFAGGNMNPNHRCVDHEIFFLPLLIHHH